ncbi:MAG: L,D-transpeptidase family protein, partial [Bdellovibrionales bacterium]|nr:L,D-transpeptidase family protein [Bdellovibrionales bacterium]
RKEGDKQILGDLKTPEGVYYFIKTYNKDQLDFNEYGVRAFVTDYPNLFDKRENKTGSGIWLHSIPPTKSLNRGSRGCVVVRISAIEEIQNFISLGTTPIIIEDKINYIDESKIKRQRTELLTWLEGWKRSWESKSLDAYMDYYSDQFKSKKMDKSKWKVYKEELNKKYNYISVQLSSPSIYKADKKYIVRFAQTYSSDQNSDFGEKTLYIKKENGQFKIVGENWAVASERLLAQKETITKNFNN